MIPVLAQSAELSDALDVAGRLADRIPDSPVFFAGAAALAGLVLWLSGARFMRGATTLAFVIAGGISGYAALPSVAPSVSPWLGAVAGGLLGMIVGVAMFRLSMALLLAALLGLSTPVTIAAGHDFQAVLTRAADRSHERSLLSTAAELGASSESGATAGEESSAGAEIGSDASGAALAAARAADFGADLLTETADYWESLPIGRRSILFLSGVAMCALGFGLGMLAPKFAAAAVTASLGAALWLSGGASLANHYQVRHSERLPEQALHWLVIWLVVSALGAAIQWLPSRKPEKRPAPRPTPDTEAAAPAPKKKPA